MGVGLNWNKATELFARLGFFGLVWSALTLAILHAVVPMMAIYSDSDAAMGIYGFARDANRGLIPALFLWALIERYYFLRQWKLLSWSHLRTMAAIIAALYGVLVPLATVAVDMAMLALQGMNRPL